MDHGRVKELLSDYIDGDLGEKERQDVEEHLERCKECCEEFEQLKKTVNVLSGFQELKAPKDFESKINDRLKKRVRRRDRDTTPLSHKVPFETICLIMLVMLIAFYIMLYLLPQMTSDEGFKQDKVPEKKEERDKKEEEERHERRVYRYSK